MEPNALASVSNSGRGREVSFIPAAGLQPIGGTSDRIFETVSEGECNIVVLGCRLARSVSTSARCQYRSESTDWQLHAHKVRVSKRTIVCFNVKILLIVIVAIDRIFFFFSFEFQEEWQSGDQVGRERHRKCSYDWGTICAGTVAFRWNIKSWESVLV